MMGIFYKTVFDISCFYAFFTFFFSYTVGHETNAFSYGVFLIAALLLGSSEAVKQYGKLLILLASIIPAGALLLETTMVGRIMVLLLWTYLLISIKREAYIIYYYHFIDKFKGFLWSLAVPGIFVVFNLEKGIAAANAAIPYLLIFLAAGVMTMQTARHRAATESRKQFERYQVFQTVVFFCFCMLLTVAGILDVLYNRVLKPAALLLTDAFFRMIGAAVSAMPKVTADLSFDMKEFQEALNEEEPAERFLPYNEWAQMIAEATEGSEEKDITPLLICLGVIVGIILLIVLMSKTAKNSRVVALDVEREDLPEEEEPKKRKRTFRNPEMIVRRQYREFMRKAETRENVVLKSDTTAEIEDKYNLRASANVENAKQITGIYRKVRYSGKMTSKEDAAMIKNLVKKA